MIKTPIPKLVITLAIPAIITMLITSLYNMADTLFVGRIGDGKIGASAVSVVFSYMAIMQAIGFFFGHGSGNYISKKLGANDTEKAGKMASTAFFLAFSIGVLLLVFGMIFLEPFAYLLQANSENIEDVKSYLFYILMGSPFIITSFVLNNQLRFQGSAYYGMIGIGIGGLLNIALDPLFIFAFNMGVAGAGLATSLSQFISFIILLIMGTRGGNIRIRLSNFAPCREFFIEIVKGGTPSLFRQGLSSVSVICLNGVANAIAGSALVAGMGVAQKIMHFIFSVLLGIGQGFQPICGYNYGAKRYDRVKKAYWFCVKYCTLIVIVASIIGFIFAENIAFLLNSNAEVCNFAGMSLRFQFCSFVLMPFIVMTNMALQNLSRVIGASVLALMRQGAAYIPLLYILQFLGVTGVCLVQPIADVVALIVAIPFMINMMKHLNSMGKVNIEQN
ncbi:MAG: MATE family efflux transporter [Clostridiales bacterium]|nr:MATE family efflux transporter [Clostridiales bacterium]